MSLYSGRRTRALCWVWQENGHLGCQQESNRRLPTLTVWPGTHSRFYRHLPIAYLAFEISIVQTHIFFYKAHILSGQVQPNGKSVTDFAWLTKQEIESRVEKSYWVGVKDMLADF